MEQFLSSIITMFFFLGAVFAAVVPSDASSIAATSVHRAEPLCAPLGFSTAPEPSSKSLSAFTDDKKYDQLALTAPIPAGYAVTMNNANCAFSSFRYMLYVQLDSYRPESCAEICNKHEGCDSFNIYIQRDPSKVPGPACPNPAPIAVTKCALYSLPEEASSCTNFGQHIGPADANGEAFKVAIRSSNAYNRVSGKQVIVTHTTTHHMHKTVTKTISQQHPHQDKRVITVTVPMPFTSTHKHGKDRTKTSTTHREPITITASQTSTSTVTVTRSPTPTPVPSTVTVTNYQPILVTVGAHTPKPQYITITRYGKRAATYWGPTRTVTVTSTGEPGTTTITSGNLPAETVTIVLTPTVEASTTTTTIDALPAETVTITLTPTVEASTTTVIIDEPAGTIAPSYPKQDNAAPSILTAVTGVEGPVSVAPMKTITIDENYTYTGPTDIPMETVTLH